MQGWRGEGTSESEPPAFPTSWVPTGGRIHRSPARGALTARSLPWKGTRDRARLAAGTWCQQVNAG